MSIELNSDGKAVNPEDIGKHDKIKMLGFVIVVVVLAVIIKVLM